MACFFTLLLATLPVLALASPPLAPDTSLFISHSTAIPNVRLPENIVPYHYTVELQPILDPTHPNAFTAPGKVWINVASRMISSNITLHALTLQINESSIVITEFPTTVTVPIAAFEQNAETEQFIIHTVDPLRAGQVYRIYMEFVAPVSRDVLVGLYLTNYTDAAGETHYMAVTDLEATDARRVFPCFDEPHLKSTFDVYVTHQKHHHVLSNMNQIRTEEVPELPGWNKTAFDRTQIMSTYLVAIAVSDFISEPATPGLYSKPVTIWGPQAFIEAGAGKFAPDVSAKLLTAMENYFQVPYTFPKMDKIAVPHFASGAMENWGLNTYKFNRLLLEPGIATTADHVSAATTLSHELVHQWFGNLVTCSWWQDLWLNEGFASYYSNTALQDIGEVEMAPLDTLVSDAVQKAMQYDASNATHPIHNEVSSPTEIRINFDTITYSKGAALVRMMNAMLTEPQMRSGLTAYLKDKDHDSAHQDDLFASLNAHVLPGFLPNGVTLKTVMDDWTLQTGFPVVSVSWMTGSTSAIMTQEAYRQDPDLPKPDTLWHVPITIQYPSDSAPNTTTAAWMMKDKIPVFVMPPAGAKWVVVNPQQTGYYRVRYSDLKPLIEQLHADHTVFDAQTRSALLDDALNLAFAGYLVPLSDALNMTMYLKKERHLVPWNTFFANMAKAYRFLGRSSGAVPFRKYVLELVSPALEDLGLDPTPGEPIANGTLLRTRLFEWACNAGHPGCVAYSVTKFREWRSDPTNTSIIFPDLRPHVLCTGVANGGDADWEFVWAEYRRSDRDVTRLNLLRALACTRSASKLDRLLGFVLNSSLGVETGHRATLISAVTGNSGGVDVAFNFVRNRVEDILRSNGPSLISTLITSLSATLHKHYDVTDLQRFVGTKEVALEPVKGAIQGAVGDMLANARWMERNAAGFGTFVNALP